MDKEFPTWLKKGALFNSFSKDSEIPLINIFKEDEIVNSENDLINYLKTADYWGINLLNDISESAENYISENLEISLDILMDLHRLQSVKSLLNDIKSKTSINLLFFTKGQLPKFQIFSNEILIYSKIIYGPVDLDNMVKMIENNSKDNYEICFSWQDIDGYSCNPLTIFYEVDRLRLQGESMNYNGNFTESYEFYIPINKYNKNKILYSFREIKKYYSKK